MFSRQTFWLYTRSMKPSILEGATKHGSKYFICFICGRFPFISQRFLHISTTPLKSYKLSSLLHGVIVFTNSSFSPNISAKQTFFGLEVRLVSTEPFACMAFSHVCSTLELNTSVPVSLMSVWENKSSSGPCMQAYMKYSPDVGLTLQLARDREQFRDRSDECGRFLYMFFFYHYSKTKTSRTLYIY